MRLIDADALKADYGMAEDCKDCKTGYRSCQYDNTYTKMDFCGWLDDAPTVDAVPVVHGRWSGDFCSKCGISKYNFIKILHDDDGPFGTWNFCPKCGAKMDVGDGSTD